jgi:hypothetical protein
MCVVGIDQAWSGCGLHWRRSRRLVNETSIVNESPFHQHDRSECENEDDDDSGDDDDDFLDAGCIVLTATNFCPNLASMLSASFAARHAARFRDDDHSYEARYQVHGNDR